MPSSYEFWLLDDAGKRLCLLENLAYFAYSRSMLGYGALLIGLPYEPLAAKLSPVFAPDRRVDVWRSPEHGFPMRREGTFLLRMSKIYTRETDNVQIVAFTGRDPTDLLTRRYVIQPAGTPASRKTAPIDDIMKAVVREQMLWGSVLNQAGALDNARAFPQGEFRVLEDVSLGPTYSGAFADRRVLDIVRGLKDSSFQLHSLSPADRKIYFDVVPYDINYKDLVIYILDEVTGDPIVDEAGLPILDERSAETESELGFRFETYADLRGIDRTNGLEFSVENNNLQAPYLLQDHLSEENAVIVKGFGRGDSRLTITVEDPNRVNASRWNRFEAIADASQEPDQTKLANAAYPVLEDGRPKEEISAVFLNVPAGPDSPRSLYGLDWDLGDLLPVRYAGRLFTTEVSIVYVAVDEKGKETVTGRNQVTGEGAT